MEVELALTCGCTFSGWVTSAIGHGVMIGKNPCMTKKVTACFCPSPAAASSESCPHLYNRHRSSARDYSSNMSSFLARTTSDSRFHLAATAVISGGVVAAGILSYQRLSHEKRVSRLKDSIPDLSDNHPLQKVSHALLPQPRFASLRPSSCPNVKGTKKRR